MPLLGDQARPHSTAPYYDHLPNSVVDDTDLVLKAVVFRENLATVLVNSQHSPSDLLSIRKLQIGETISQFSLPDQAQHQKKKLNIVKCSACVIAFKLLLRVDQILDQKFSSHW